MAGPKAGEGIGCPLKKYSSYPTVPGALIAFHCILNQEMMGPMVERDSMKRFNYALGAPLIFERIEEAIRSCSLFIRAIHIFMHDMDSQIALQQQCLDFSETLDGSGRFLKIRICVLLKQRPKSRCFSE